jgi:hypothetical protein
VTGVQTCALPIFDNSLDVVPPLVPEKASAFMEYSG